MKPIFKIGQQKTHNFVVKNADVASFEEKIVHQVCSTFALAREIEWSSRLFVLDMIESDEEGIGTMLAIDHISPALEGEEVEIIASVGSLKNNELICDIKVIVDDRIIAVGKTGQKILKKEKIEQLFVRLKKHGKERK